MISGVIKLFIGLELFRIIFYVFLLFSLLFNNIENTNEYLNNFSNTKKTVLGTFTDYMNLRCLTKKKCCYILFIIDIIYCIIKLLFLHYILKTKKYKLLIIYFSLFIIVKIVISLIRHLFKINPNQIEFMCPMTQINLYNEKYLI